VFRAIVVDTLHEQGHASAEKGRTNNELDQSEIGHDSPLLCGFELKKQT
jgi:hypothetical protein